MGELVVVSWLAEPPLDQDVVGSTPATSKPCRCKSLLGVSILRKSMQDKNNFGIRYCSYSLNKYCLGTEK